jgi:ribonuclease HI
MSQEERDGKQERGSEPEAHAYTDGASKGSRVPGGYGAVLRWEGKIEEFSGGEQNTTNQRMDLTAAA